jgi:arylsulfatase A-like enzyme
LRDAGYRTALAGKWQINNLYEQPGALEKHGFEEHCVWPGGRYGDPSKLSRYWDPYIIENDRHEQRLGEFGPDVYSDFLIDFMRRDDDRPFLACFAMHLTHAPLVPTPLEPEAKEFDNRRATDTAQFGAMVRYSDHLVGKLVEALEAADLRDDTLILLATDNGSPGAVDGCAWGLDIRGGKGQLTESGINVPLIFNWPGRIRGGRTLTQLADFSDIFPTLVELANARSPEGLLIDGRSLAPLLLEDPAFEPRSWIFSQYAERRVVRDERFKLYSDGPLFDAEADPLEQKNLQHDDNAEAAAARKSLANVLASLPPDTELPWEPRSQSWFQSREQQPQAR